MRPVSARTMPALAKRSRAQQSGLVLWIRRNKGSRIFFVKNIRQLRFFKTTWDGKLAIANRVLIHGGDRTRDFRSVIDSARAGLVCLILFADDHARANRQAREIAKVGHSCVGCIPEFGFDGLELRQNGSAVGIIGRNPVDGFEIRRVVGVLLGFVTVDYFLLTRRRQLGFFMGSFLAAELI